MTDYAATPHAHQERYQKAQQIAALAWDLGLTPEDILCPPGAPGLADRHWAALARRATGKPASDETRRLAYCHLSLKEAWAAGHPAEPGSKRAVRPVAEVAAELARRGS